MEDKPWWESATDAELVDASGLSGTRAVTAGLAMSDPRGFQAHAELTRRLTDELRSSGATIATLTRWLVGLTAVLVILTLVLVWLAVRLDSVALAPAHARW